MSWNVIVYKNQLKKNKQTNKKALEILTNLLCNHFPFSALLLTMMLLFLDQVLGNSVTVLYNTDFVQKFILKL